MSTNPYNDDKRLLELLERWQSGDFSRADEQELQALADSDAFRRETVEGFWSLPEAEHPRHLASLRARLRGRIGGGRRVVLPQILAAVAAVAMLVLAVVWLIPSENKTVPTTQQEAAPPPENQPIASNFPEEKIVPASPQGTVSPQADRGVSQTATPGQSYPTMAESSPAASGAAPEIFSAKPPAPSDGLAFDTLSGAVSEGEYAKVLDEQDDVDLSQGNMAKRAEAKKDVSDKAKAKTSDAKKQSKPSAPSASQPAGGWSNFQDYLRRNARLPEAARQNNVSGSVRLQFRLDENNQPIGFQTLRSLGYGCDEEAIRLVKAYAWQRGNDPELTVEVPFVR